MKTRNLAVMAGGLLLALLSGGCTTLYDAAEEGDVATIRSVVSKHNINEPGPHLGRPLLSYAVVNRRKEVVRELIAKGANLELQDRQGQSPLHLAVDADLEIVKLLVEAGADIDAQTDAKAGLLLTTPLMKAVGTGRPEIVSYLVEKGADVFAPNHRGETLLHALHAHYQNGPRPLAGLERLLADLRRRDAQTLAKFLDSRDKHGQTPLHIAAYWGLVDLVKLLVAHGADPNAPVANRPFVAPLRAAAVNGHEQTMQALIAGGADPQLRSHQNQTAADILAWWRQDQARKRAAVRAEQERQHAAATARAAAQPRQQASSSGLAGALSNALTVGAVLSDPSGRAYNNFMASNVPALAPLAQVANQVPQPQPARAAVQAPRAPAAAATPAAPDQAAAPLRFMLYRTQKPTAADSNNWACFSSVVTLPAPSPRWGTPEARSQDFEQARAIIRGYHGQFAQACAKWGPPDTSHIGMEWDSRARPAGAEETYQHLRRENGGKGEVRLGR
jgi:ankyrin repeat protein